MLDIYKKLENCLNKKDFRKLKSESQKFSEKYPADINILNYYAIANFFLSNFDLSKEVFEKILNLDPGYFDAHLYLARIYSKLDILDLSINYYDKALAINKFFFIYNELGLVYFRKKSYEQALLNFIKSIKLNKNFYEGYFNIGLVYHSANNISLAIKSFEEAIKYNPKYAEAFNNLGLLYVELNQLDNAIYNYNQAIKYNPNLYLAYTNLSQVYLSKGDFEKVDLFLSKSLEINNNDTEAHRLKSVITKYNDSNHPHLLQMLSLAKDNLAGEDSLMRLNFALAKAYEDINEYKLSGDFLIKANELRRKNFNYNISDDINQFDMLKSYFNYEFFLKNKKSGYRTAKPIFVVGMPRSGTTLVEQIISSHPDVYGAGELEFLANLINKYFNKINPLDFFEAVKESDMEVFKKIGLDYFNLITDLSKDKKFIIDKMPVNFRLIGFIKVCLPDARIIHCKRFSKDNCLSIFKNFFGKNVMPWAYNQDELAIYYNNYIKLMKHWNLVLPNYIYEISYEKLINNQEFETRNLLKFCNLEWNDACLDFYKNKRNVSTASVNQVRQRIYKSSLESWKNYEEKLSNMFNKLN